MRILVTGASGFIGRHVADRLASAGHQVLRVGRDVRGRPGEWLAMDFAAVPSSDEWLPHLSAVDVVVNAVGIFREQGSQTFDKLHVQAPGALFQACARAGVRRVIHFSALGADVDARSAYHLSKRSGDEELLALGLDALVLQPSLVFGLDGPSSQLFLQWAALPWLPVPQGAGPVQPVHVDDVSELVWRLAEARAAVAGQRLAVVGARALAWHDYLQALRSGMGLAPAPSWRIPEPLVGAAARVAARIPGSLVGAEAWNMLRRGNVAPGEATARALGRSPRPVDSFIGAAERSAVRTCARLLPALLLLRWCIAAVWIGTAIVSAGAYPVADSLALLERVGAHGQVARLLLFGAAGLDLVLGLATLLRPRRSLWWSQIALVLLYSILIAWRLPEYWLHPYGPMLKNLPMLAGLCLLLAIDGRRA